MAGGDAGQQRAAALKVPAAASISPRVPAVAAGVLSVGAGCVLARARGRAGSFLAEARRGPSFINIRPERHISHRRSGHTEHILRGPVARTGRNQTVQDAGTDKRRAARLDDTEQARVAEQAQILGNR